MTLTNPPSERVLRKAAHPRHAAPSSSAAPVLHPLCHRSEAFAEDLVEPVDTLRVHAPGKRRRATLLFVVPLGAAFLGSALPLLNQIV